jgi:23S rRNA pseudouridine955/2504/2580 synthase
MENTPSSVKATAAIHTIHIDLDGANQRFDRFLRKFYKPYTTISLAMIYSWLRKWHIRVNGKKTSEDKKILLGDVITIDMDKTSPMAGGKSLTPQQKIAKNDAKNSEAQARSQRDMLKRQICFEDDNRLVFNKPPHILMHPGSGSSKQAVTMNDRLYTYLNKTAQNNAAVLTKWSTFKPAFCYRLDKDTSGVLIAAKTYEALQYLNDQIRERHVEKRYIVAVHGRLPAKMIIDKPLFKGFHGEQGKSHMFVNYEKGVDAKTIVYSLDGHVDAAMGEISLWLVRLLTGRMHQIRAHLSAEWFSIIGDKDYGSSPALLRIAHGTYRVARQLLHSFSYGFTDQYSWNHRTIVAATPDDIQKFFTHISPDAIARSIAKFRQERV